MRKIALFLIIVFSYVLLPLKVIAQDDIIAAEYYLDVDPGCGLGTSIPVGLYENFAVNFSLNLPTASISPGFHTINIRVKNQLGLWSVADSKVFYLSTDPVVPVATTDIVEAVYFFGADPGIDSANNIPIPLTSGSTVNFYQLITTAAPNNLPPGFHTISIRVKNQAGVWSVAETKAFYLSTEPAVPVATTDIVEAVYFFGADP